MPEIAITFECAGTPLVGILHLPETEPRAGVLIIVGGPQYRVGSHRQFVHLARHLANLGIAAFRFDYRGIGDGAGPSRNFLDIGEDIKAALDAFCGECPAINEVYIWGLCDAASAALFYAHVDRRIAGIALCNPWVRTHVTFAQAVVKDYYRKQIFSPIFWKRLAGGELDVRKSLVSLIETVRAAFGRREKGAIPSALRLADQEFPAKMLDGLKLFRGRVLLILSGNDLTSAEFENLVRANRGWTDALKRKNTTLRRLSEANHTFATTAWKDQVASWTALWVKGELPESDTGIK